MNAIERSSGFDRQPTLSIFGLGYVGCVSAACLASRGYRVIGVDVNPQKTEVVRRGLAPVVEERIGDVTARAVESGNLTVSDDPERAVLDSDLTMVCVGTPSRPGGGISTAFLERATEQIGAALAQKAGWHVIVYRSTMVPGTCEEILIPILERESGKHVGRDFGVCVNPEFLREGTSVRDFFAPSKIVVGESDERSGTIVMSLYDGLHGQRFRVPVAVAEMSKYVDNSFHALKVAFSNEIGAVCASFGLDSHAVMNVFLADTKLNISPAYLRPGFAFGGSCLPKDLRALLHAARQHDIDIPVISNVLVSNESQLRRTVDIVTSLDKRKVGIFGLAFKPGTDDLRESPVVELAERLLGKGYDVLIYDSNVSLSRLIGGNRSYIDERLPHIGHLLTDDVDRVLDHSEVLVAGSKDPEVIAALDRAEQHQVVVDLVRLPNAESRRLRVGYVGIGW
ncbi:nucleotide sugar dehydrogenase [Rhodococcus sp. T2V]|uniref:nucleotide sugar dehydrogenase n=1 Tax=Rhodococcus sp. T2V TaxID=3034164 RepID=UPI0023E320F2|nr:nucleotide sugar dehydrogenase [Rhodococcus sp. T2V]